MTINTIGNLINENQLDNTCAICKGKHFTSLHKCYICNLNHNEKYCTNRCSICKGEHITSLHKCTICNVIGSDHMTYYCPQRCPCNGYHTILEHRCLYCCVRNPDHKDDDCEFRFNIRRN